MAQPWGLACLGGLVVFSAALTGCGDATGAVDAGRDASQKNDVRRPMCAGMTVTCDGTIVRACRNGKPAESIQECGPTQTCSQGRCTSPECAKVETNLTSLEGCTFYTFDLDNVTSDDSLSTSVLVTNPGQILATATLEQRQAGVWTAVASTPVAPMLSARLVLPDNHLEGGGVASGGAFRLTSDLPVTVAHIQSDDSSDQGSSSTGGTLLLPAHVLGRRYRALTYVQVATPRLTDTPGARGGAGQLVVVGTQDHTNVTITPSTTATIARDGNLPPPGPGGIVTLMLEDGDVLQLYSGSDGADLSGTQVAADKPVAVFSGNISTTYGVSAVGISSPDLAHEQLLPVAAWGTSYVAAQLTPQSGVCDWTLDPPGSSIWRVVADQTMTTEVHFTVAPGSKATPPPDRTIGAGEVFQIYANEDFAVSSSLPILVMQGMDCEPTLSSAVPTTAWLTDYWFAVLPSFDTQIALVRHMGQPVYLDGAALEDSLFAPVSGDFDVARVPIAPCARQDVVCTHHLEGQFGFTMRGMDVLCSYALTAPTWVPCSNVESAGCN